jgi:hypothetical protein
MSRRTCPILAAGLLLAAATALAQEPTTEPTIVLDTGGPWRMLNGLQPPVIDAPDGLQPLLFDTPWLDVTTDLPDPDWTGPDFDDASWMRAPLLRFAKTPYLARLALRGRFRVADPAKVRDLKLSLDFYGGAVVYLNGAEIARAHLPAGPVGPDTLAEAYPVEAFAAGDKLIGERGVDDDDNARAHRTRRRQLADVLLPARLLRPGVNVLAVQIVRAPYHHVHNQLRRDDRGQKPAFVMPWNTCEVRQLRLTADSPDGLVPNAVRPPGLQVYNSDLMMSDFDMDWGDPNEPLRPVRIVAPRNGAFSGKVVVAAPEPIRALKATAADLTGPDGATIPAHAVRLRYAIPHGSEFQLTPYSRQLPLYPRSPEVLSALIDQPLDEFPVPDKPAPGRPPAEPVFAEPVLGAVVPVWITVNVPADATPGLYKGHLRIVARNAQPVSVPVEVNVAPWTLPDTQNFRTWVDLVQSPDTLAEHYQTPLWSDDHWRMIARSFRLAGDAGSRMLYIPLIAQTNLGHEQSMVRWIRKTDGSYDHDLSVLDRYLDTAVREMGEPKIVVLWVWEIYMMKSETARRDHLWLEQAAEARKDLLGKGPLVTVLDPATGTTSTEHLPSYEAPASKALWKPVLDKVMDRLKARGLDHAVMLGMLSDQRPTQAEIAFFNDLHNDIPWALHGHFGVRAGARFHNIARVEYQALVWSVHHSGHGSLHGWNRPNLVTHYDRDRSLNPKTPILWYHLAETAITGDQRGIGRLGADFWPVFHDRRGNRTGHIWQRYIHSSWRNLDLHSYCLAPGPVGPVASSRYELLREGVQHCEARIVIEEALLRDELRAKLGDELAKRCHDVLLRRQHAMARGLHHFSMDQPQNRAITNWRAGDELAGQAWFAGSDWQQRSLELFSLADEVARATSQ